MPRPHVCARLLYFALLFVAALPMRAQLPISSDDFESANTLAWDVRVGITLLPAESFRHNLLALRDPHVFVDLPIFGCFDFTDTDLPLGAGPSLNSQIATAIATDGDGDGFLDLSTLLLFRPYDGAALGVRVDTGPGACTAPPAPLSCDLDGVNVPQTIPYDALAAGSCLAPDAGTTSGYTPAVPEPTGPCFVTASRDALVDFAGVPVLLRSLQLAASQVGSPAPTGFLGGLQRGFLSEADADLILLPATVPIVGGQPISILFPGGTGNCAAGDDRDTVTGESGWWFYFEFESDEVTYVGP